MSKKYYVVGAISRRQKLNCTPPIEINLTWAEGQIGAIPVFTSKANAKKYAGKAEIFIVK